MPRFRRAVSYACKQQAQHSTKYKQHRI